MEENLIQSVSQNFAENTEPLVNDNSNEFRQNFAGSEVYGSENNGQSGNTDPNSELILGKFKSVEELAKAYDALQKKQGENSEELGNLRKQASEYNSLNEAFEQVQAMQKEFESLINQDREKYNTSEYFQDSSFREIYKEALMALKGNLDTDKFVSLLESYVESRIASNEKKNSAIKETEQILDSMTYEKNPRNSLTPPQKSFDEMTPKEIDELLERLI